MTLPPVAMLLSVVGLVRKRDTGAARCGLIVGFLLTGLLLVVPFVLRCL